MAATMPAELLQLIVENASLSVLKVLRRVSKTLHTAASRRLFTSLTVDDDHSGFLACLAARDSHLAPAFDALDLRTLAKGRRSFLRRVIPCSKRTAPDNLLIVLRHLEQVSSVSIDVKAFRSMPVDVRATTIQALGALPSLRSLKLDLRDGDAAAPLIDSFAHTFHNLQTLHIVGGAAHYSTLSTIVKNSPCLTSLTVHARQSVSHDALGQLLHSIPDTSIDTLDVDAALATSLSSATIMQHLGSLRSLTVGARAPESVWNSLRSSRIALHTLKTSSPSSALMSYLQSFTGLRSLSVDAAEVDPLDFPCCCSGKIEDESFPEFWSDVVRTHSSTLERLEATGCILSSVDVDAMVMCSRLQSMRLCVDGRDSSDNVPAALFDAIDHGLFPRLRYVDMIMYSHPLEGDAGLVRAHHALQDLVAEYECSAPSEYMRALRVNTGHMADSVIMKDELDSRWAFQFS